MNMDAYQKMSYGLYLISAKDGEKNVGCVVNTLEQVTAEPIQFAVAIHKNNYTAKVIQQSGYFTGVVLSESASMDLIGAFGFHSSKDYDKFEKFKTTTDENGIAYICEQAAARFSFKVVNSMDAGTHILFLAKVQEAELLGEEKPMTYAYYHQVKKGLTPPKASSYVKPEEVKGYRCSVCGYVLEADAVPDDFICPICKQGKDKMVKIS